ncbi:DUF1553 domain-containing protein [Aporhodopirellula aestuarii]|uniref:DUF1553 domain-containing protein n=1 Tax=Aporhodopirellula aestuarii TaxID=2950107 RepID=A0ABT0TXL8_9BACT|nr:DUF1553 domain-containing protein [Aporhodopirellula aestuarii]MCM2369280.1 DUF1553 domain-containing protein [Aporhodopirellula aestuarii]
MNIQSIFAAITLAIPCLSSAQAAEANIVAKWTFDSEEAAPLDLNGEVERDQAGPRPPEYPEFSDDNTALKFNGGGYLAVPKVLNDDRFQFRNGDKITIEAWVNLDAARDGQQMYVIGKGRTGSPQFRPDNQNWALRTVSHGGTVRASFLFATKLSRNESHWHRWTTDDGFECATGWHHIAVAYHFGNPESVRGWIDGQPAKGRWDMGGPTEEPPVVDDDAVWIGSSRGGGRANSFVGHLDNVAIHRDFLSDEVIASRFHRVGGPRVAAAKPVPEPLPEVAPELNDVPAGKVLFTFAEGLPSNARWLLEGESWPEEITRWTSNAFLLPRVPVRYDSWGIRGRWNSPMLVRAASDVSLPPGRHRVLVRARSLSRLWIDGKVVARTRKNSHGGGNLQPIVPIADPPAPGNRVVRFPQQEVFGEYVVEGGQTKSVRVIFELVVGGKGRRTESGEVCIAIQPEDSNTFVVLGPSLSLPLTDEAAKEELVKMEESLTRLDDFTRRAASSSQDGFWNHRHEIARDAMELQNHRRGRFGDHLIDEAIANKIGTAVAKSNRHDEKTTTHFYDRVLPILRDQCFRCHGEKGKGGLRLNSHEAVLASGESGEPAVVPGDPDNSELIVQIRDGNMPPTDTGLTPEQIETLEHWVASGAVWPAQPVDPVAIAVSPVIRDEAFLRRAYLDVVGVPPSEDEAGAFLKRPNRDALIDTLLADERYADNWVSLWMDLLAENPTLLNVSLGSTGPFRWFLYESLRDNKPLDRMVTELILMRGDAHYGGSAGFAIAGENDSPMAAKAHVLAAAFLGIDLQCARCHDSPYHSTTQEDLFSLGAMLSRKSITPPKTSRVPDEFFVSQTREPLIQVTLKLGEAVKAKWPFADFTGAEDSPQLDRLMHNPKDARERLAALFTAPSNVRFPRVMVNHLWKRLMGAGFVEPVHDWEGRTPSHPELLEELATELVTHDYNLKHVLRLIMTSDAYQREATGQNEAAPAEQRYFAAPDRRRLTAEQVVDSLFVASGCEMDVEELTFLHDGTQSMDRRVTLGTPTRAWMFAGLNNERDRPSLSLPRAQAVVDVLEAFGWTGTRQQPIIERETDPNVLQPGILANGNLSKSLTRAAHESELADLAVKARSSEQLVESLFLRFLSRYPNDRERELFVTTLENGFANRLLLSSDVTPPPVDPLLPQSTWTNHLLPEANEIQQEWERRVRRGPYADPRLRPEWREVYEDVVWSLVNHAEFVWVP